MQMNLLRQYGLSGEEYVIDIGCGSGRLANALTRYSALRYLGTDVVDQFLDYAKTITNRPDWRFERTNGLTIPSPDAQADFVTFFSVFTHLLHEESYTLLLEARRVLKPGGHVIFSFLDFAVESHWSIFEDNLRTLGDNTPLNMFLARKAIRVWARHLHFELVDLFQGSEPHIKLPEPIPLDNGTVATGLGTMGQSVAVYRKPVD
jgi:ubiquinone/menaquinone biosynthesis C-methylase UbiE